MERKNLQALGVFLTERLNLAAQDILKAVEETVSEYHAEISRSKREISVLRERLLDAGLELYPELVSGLPVLTEVETSAEHHFGGEPWGQQKHEEMQVKLEISATKEEAQISQSEMVEESFFPNGRLGNEQKTEEMFQTSQREEEIKDVLPSNACLQIKEEPAESFYDAQTCVSSVVTFREDELDGHRLSLTHKAIRSKIPLTNKVKLNRDKRCSNPLGQDRELAQRRERYRMKRPRGISRRPKVGRDRKLEQRLDNQRTYRMTTERLPDLVMLDQDESLAKQLHASPSDEYRQHEQELSEMFRNPPEIVGGANLCVVCGRSFGSRGLLKIHLRVHSGEKPYNCHFCDKTFRQSSHLSVHVRIHTGEKPYSCPTCEKRFSDRSARNRHLKVHLESAHVGPC